MAYDYEGDDNRVRRHLKYLKWVIEYLKNNNKVAGSITLEDIPKVSVYYQETNSATISSSHVQDITVRSIGRTDNTKEGPYRDRLLGELNRNNEEQLQSEFATKNAAFKGEEGTLAIAEMKRLFAEFFREASEDSETPQGDTSEPKGFNPKDAANLLNRRKNIILEGPPGTGKTYAMKGIVNALKEDGLSIGKEGKDDFAITMHPATSYEDFIEGIRPGAMAGQFGYSAGVFVEKVKHAIRNPLEQHVVLLDELNRCNVPRVLGDLLTTIESSKRTNLNFKNEISYPLKVKSTFDFIVASLKDVGHAADNGLRFSEPPMNNQNHDDGSPRFYVNPEDKKISKEKGVAAQFRALKVIDFKGDYGAMATFEPNLQIHDDKKKMKKVVVLIFINKIGHPVLDSEWIKTILQDVDEKPDEVEIELLGESGGMKFTSSNVTDLSFDTDGFIKSGKIDLIAKLNGPCDDCPPNTDYYWCENCDGNWDKTDRTEIAFPGSKRRFHVPNNLLVVGTMNTTDRSVAPLDAALRRRFVFLRVDRSKLSTEDINDLPAEGGSRELLRETQDLWEKLNKELEDILGKDATIGHSYLYELRTELKNEADPEKLENLVVEFWRYSVLPQVADLLDATGKASDIWDSIDLKTQFEALGLKMNTGKKKYRTFSRTIVELTEPGPQPEPQPGPED
jgi:MoxR-like ATPase